MTTVFFFCAVAGGTILVCQFGMTLLGLGGHDHGDMDLAHDGADGAVDDTAADDGHDSEDAHDDDQSHTHRSTWLFGVISFRTMVAAIAFFGIAGMAANAAELSLPQQMVIAVVSGIGAMYLVYWLMSLLYGLGEDNTVRIDCAVGCEGKIYVAIPACESGRGKIQLDLQGRLMEYEAVTAVPTGLPTGSRVVVVAVVGGGVLEVAPAEQQTVAGQQV
ncbi:MAG: hypothetical protein H8E44_08170 [Planctomycetes bacterium]|nr:hypothetical protein [Planctomycetota bacterium]